MCSFVRLIGEMIYFKKTQDKFGISFIIDLLVHI